MLSAMAAPRKATLGQRTRVYFGLADEATEGDVHDSLNYRRQAIGVFVLVVIGVALCFWSLTVGLIVILVPVVGLAGLVVRHKGTREGQH